MKVLHVTECYAAGVRRAIDAIAMNNTSYEHHLLWADPDGEVGSVPPFFDSSTRLPRHPLSRARMIRRFATDLQPDLIHAHSSWAGIYSRALRQCAPVIYQPHGYKFADRGTHPIISRLTATAERAMLRRTAATVVLSPHEEELARSIGAKSKTFLLPNTPSIGPVSVGERALSPTDTTPTHVLMIGRITPQKDPQFFAEVAASIHKDHPQLTFRWLGGGEDAEVTALQSAGVEVSGWLTPEDLEAELRRPAIYLHSAAYEGFPISILDASSMGLPVLVRPVPSFNGIPLPTAGPSPRAAAAAVAAVVTDPVARRHVALAAIELIDSMNPAAQRTAIDSLYSSIGQHTK